MRQGEFSGAARVDRQTHRASEGHSVTCLDAGDANAVAAIFDELAHQAVGYSHCDADHVLRWGSDNGLPRLRCTSCCRTSNPLTRRSPGFGGAKVNRPSPSRSGEGGTLEEAADRCSIHRNTAHRCRQRFLLAPTAYRVCPSGTAEADETLVLRPARVAPMCGRH
jgi:hypothetical protein